MLKTTQDLVKSLDAGLRHKNDMTQDRFVSHYCKLFAKHAYATRDESWNELEKTITHVLGMMIYYKRFCELKGFKGSDGDCFDPRDQVWKIEDLQNEIIEKQRALDLLTNKSN